MVNRRVTDAATLITCLRKILTGSNAWPAGRDLSRTT